MLPRISAVVMEILMFIPLLAREINLHIKQKSDWATIILFFLMIVSLFPLALTQASAQLANFASGIIWIAALLAIMLSLTKHFASDYQAGIHEVMLLSSQSLLLLVTWKIVAHWLVIVVPIILLTPIAGIFLQLSANDLEFIMLTLLLGTPALSFYGAIAAMLTISLPRGGILLTTLVLPLYMPILIFATSAAGCYQHGLPYSGQLALLAAVSIISVLLAPLVVAQAMKISVGF